MPAYQLRFSFLITRTYLAICPIFRTSNFVHLDMSLLEQIFVLFMDAFSINWVSFQSSINIVASMALWDLKFFLSLYGGCKQADAQGTDRPLRLFSDYCKLPFFCPFNPQLLPLDNFRASSRRANSRCTLQLEVASVTLCPQSVNCALYSHLQFHLLTNI